jgi:uncharacterized protein
MATPERPLASDPETPERIHSLDVLRGFALLGMLIVHFHMRSSEPGGIDDVVRTLVWRLVESKSHGTFALLFGAGFAILLRRTQARGEPFTAFYLRRLAVLAIFGIVAHACFGFNVLLGYAIWGLPLLVLSRWPTRALIVTTVLLTVSLAIYFFAVTSYLEWRGGVEAVEHFYQARQTAAVNANEAVQVAGLNQSYAELLSARLRHMAWFYTQPFFFVPGLTLALFIVGLLFVRHGVFEHVRAHRRLLIGLAAFGVVSWVADDWLLPSWGVAGTFGLLRDQWLTLTYVSGALLLFDRFPSLVTRLHFVGSAGRMALTNYLVQIQGIDLLFSGYGFAFVQVRPVVGLAMAFVFFALEAMSSVVWLKFFRFGPAEWLWRTLTYARVQPNARRALT